MSNENNDNESKNLISKSEIDSNKDESIEENKQQEKQ